MVPPLAGILAVAGFISAQARTCSWQHEDCTHTACCHDQGHTCYKKNNFWAGCRKSCRPGIHHHDPPQHRTPWSCEVVDDSHPDCAADHGDCIHLGCCKNPSHKCYMKNPAEAYCKPGRPHGWLGHEIVAHVPSGDASHPGANNGGTTGGTSGGGTQGTSGGAETHNEDLSQNWRGGMKCTHYWDCSGQGCDASSLQPWDKSKYVSPPQYAPINPEHHGGSVYGEKIWMTGATSDAVSAILGPDANDCGTDNGGGGGCGQCLLVKTHTAVNKDWLVVIMKKNRCPPWSHGCGAGQHHLDFAVPGFDHLQYSTANICGNSGTTLAKHESAICGSVAPHQCNCAQIPEHTPALKRMRQGCELFKAWGWTVGTPMVDWRPVPCPRKFVEQVKIGAAFGPQGPITVTLYDNTTVPRDIASPKGAMVVRSVQHWSWAVVALLPLLGAAGLARGLLTLRRSLRSPGNEAALALAE